MSFVWTVIFLKSNRELFCFVDWLVFVIPSLVIRLFVLLLSDFICCLITCFLYFQGFYLFLIFCGVILFYFFYLIFFQLNSRTPLHTSYSWRFTHTLLVANFFAAMEGATIPTNTQKSDPNKTQSLRGANWPSLPIPTDSPKTTQETTQDSPI